MARVTPKQIRLALSETAVEILVKHDQSMYNKINILRNTLEANPRILRVLTKHINNELEIGESE